MKATGENSSSIALLLGIDKDPTTGFWLLYALIVLLCIIVYKLGFAKKLPVLKSLFIYILLLVGCFPLAILGIGLPVAEGLIVSAIFLGAYRYRLYKSKKKEAQA
ncbi:YlaH-like family protein [Fictibacillus iocasae]|uniref:YlaH-like family protein n=1 Tax=Fictibacillus iocasae TaxID=2715437 RepID=A0ABW2NR13_9BACL